MEPLDMKSPESPVRTGGLSVAGSVLFIIGEMAGSGILSLSKAIANMGWAGIAVILFICINSGVAGVYLAKCWDILEERWIEYKKEVRYPYAAIGTKAFGNWMGHVVSTTVNLSQLGSVVVLLLLCAENIQSMLYYYWPEGTLCIWLVIVSAAFCPLSLFGSPKDFWFTGLAAFLSTVLASFLCLAAVIIDSKHDYSPVYLHPNFEQVALAFGTILFAFGGASTFPTFQNDMKDRSKFALAITLGFIGLTIVYVPVATAGYVVYGSYVSENLLLSVATGPLVTTVKILLALHFFFGGLIMFNPSCQEIEEFFKVPVAFNWRRCLVRVTLLAIILFVGLSLPSFGKILNLIGGMTMTLTTFIFPAVLYMRLCDQPRDPDWPKRPLGKFERAYLIAVTVLGFVGMVVVTYVSIKDIVTEFQIRPCYLDWAKTPKS